MVIACRCEKCNHLFINQEDDLSIELDFKRKVLTFQCRNKNCNHENIFDWGGWNKKQQQSPLPLPRMF